MKKYEIIKEYKGLKEKSSKNIDIIDINGQQIGRLITVNKEIANDDKIVLKMLEWREKNKKYFFTGFQPKLEASKQWLINENVLKENKIFFLVEDRKGKLVGHLAFKDITSTVAELDSVLRGEHGEDKSLFIYAQAYAIDFMFRKLALQQIIIHVLGFNKKVVDNHKNLRGAYQEKEYYLYKKTTGDGIFQHEIVSEDGKNVDYTYVELIVKPEKFYEQVNKFFTNDGDKMLFESDKGRS